MCGWRRLIHMQKNKRDGITVEGSKDSELCLGTGPKEGSALQLTPPSGRTHGHLDRDVVRHA